MEKKLFGTDGIRGKAGFFPINKDICYSAGYSFAKFIENKKVIVGSDTRESSDWIIAHIKKGLIDGGVEVVDAGILPTPVIAFATKNQCCGGGIVVTASHNPYEDNGIKFFNKFGKKYLKNEETQLESLILENLNKFSESYLNIEKRNFINEEITKNYLNNILDNIDLSKIIKFLPLDCANGAASYFVNEFKKKFDIELNSFNISPNGKNINEKCGAASFDHIDNNSAALDGDGDRIIFKDSNGNLINGDILLMFLAENLKTTGIVGTVMTNQAVDDFCKNRNLKFFRTNVGDRFVREKMDEESIVIGGETSGHLIYDKLNFTGDGFAIYLKIVQLLNENSMNLNDLFEKYSLFPQSLINITVKEKLPFEKLEGFNELKEDIEQIFKNDGGRIFPRYSGTENYLRILLETKTISVLNIAEKKVFEFKNTLEEK